MTNCACPGCPDGAVYREPTEHGDGVLKVCKRHVDPTKDGIERID